MKRKNTKTYRELADKYCLKRSEYEDKMSQVEVYEKRIVSEKAAFESMSKELQENPNIKAWYEEFIGTCGVTIDFTNLLCGQLEREMYKYGSTLIKDYGVDLDMVYNEWAHAYD